MFPWGPHCAAFPDGLGHDSTPDWPVLSLPYCGKQPRAKPPGPWARGFRYPSAAFQAAYTPRALAGLNFVRLVRAFFTAFPFPPLSHATVSATVWRRSLGR